MVWVDGNGIERIIYPAIKTSNPLPLLQDDNYEYLFDEQNGEIITADESVTRQRFQTRRSETQEGVGVGELLGLNHFGRRYGLDPQHAQTNGTFYIDPISNIVYFDSNMAGRIVTLKYISDGLGTDEEMVVHKFAEEALYKYIAYAILSTRANTQEYMVARFKREMVAAKRNAKLRLSNIKIEEMAQIMRGKSKQIKH